jgi:NCS1 family nucleobase:cation symporter-1
METLAAPFLIIVGLLLLGWAIGKAGSLGEILSQPSKFQSTGEFLAVFIPGLTGMVGFWATLSLNISDFTRYARSQRDQAIGQAIGLPPTMTLFAFIGVGVTSATAIIFGRTIWDPVELIGLMDNKIVVAFALFAITVATISTNIAANIVSPANDFSNIAPRHISFRIGGTIAGIIGILIMPWKLMENASVYIGVWLIGYSALLGPIAAVLICDYFLVKRRRLMVEELYKVGGRIALFNPVAIAALFLGILPNLPGFINSLGAPAEPGFWDKLYAYAWFNGFAISFALYYLLSRAFGDRSYR